MASPELLQDLLENAAAASPDRIAVVHGEERRSYRYIDENANRIAHALLKAGVKKGDRVGILMPNSVNYICSYFAISKVGGIAVPINTALAPQGLHYVLKDAGIRVLIFHRSIRAADSLPYEASNLRTLLIDGEAPLHSETRSSCSVDLRALQQILEEEPCTPPPVQTLSREELACLLYTSGSTGEPKGVMLTHANLLANTRSIVAYLQLGPDDKVMVVLPFYYCYGASLMHTHFLVSGTLVLENQFLYPNRILEKMEQDRVTGFAGVPSTFAILLRRSNIRAFSFDHLRYVTQAGGAMAPALIQELRATLPRARIFIMYGQTEASARLSYLPPEYLEKKLGSIGKGIQEVEIKVLNEKGEQVQPGEVGEIVARGPNIMQGYWNSPEETQKVLDKHGRLHTGDLARVDEDGFIYIVDRKKDMIKSGAHRVSAKEIEDTLLEEPSVLECAVIGIDDEMMGEAIKAFVVPVKWDDRSEDRLLNSCKKRLPPYKVPRAIEFMRSLPKSGAGKIMKALLKEKPTSSQQTEQGSNAGQHLCKQPDTM